MFKHVARVCFLLLLLVKSTGPVQTNISATERQDATLPCKAANNKNILAVSWTRPDLKENQLVFFYRDGYFEPDNHPSYKNRVELKDRTMKDGDVSLILKKVTFNDSGTYKCLTVQRGENNNNSESHSFISLSVVPSRGDPEGQGWEGGREDEGGKDGGGGHVGLSAGLLWLLLALFLV